MMDKELLIRANKLGAKGYEFIDWIPPQTSTQDNSGMWIVRQSETMTTAETAWYDK